TESTPAETITRVNRVLTRRCVDSRFATLVYGVLTSTGELTYCNAGHNPPFVIGTHGLRRLDQGGVLLGAFNDATFSDETVQLTCGDTVLVFSDGVTEAFNADGVEFGEERLLSCVTTDDSVPATVLQGVLDSLRKFCGDATVADDVTLLLMRYTG